MFNWLRGKVSKRKKRFQDGKFDLDLAYIGDRIIAMGYPAQGFESCYRNDFTDVRKFLDQRHKDNYKVYNLCSERVYDPKCFYGRVERFPFDDHNPPHIDLIRQFCISAKAWLDEDEKHIAVVHCKAGKGRTGVMICALLVHMGVFQTANEAMRYYGRERTKNEKGVTIPAQRRYVRYYEKFLRLRRPLDREIEMRPVELKRVRFMNLPDKLMTHEMKLHIEVMDGGCVFDSKKAGTKPLVSRKKGQMVFDLDGKVPPITGEFQVAAVKGGKKKFWVWYNSEFLVALRDDTEREDVDKAAKSKAFSNQFKVVLNANRIGQAPEGAPTQSAAQTADTPAESQEQEKKSESDSDDSSDSKSKSKSKSDKSSKEEEKESQEPEKEPEQVKEPEEEKKEPEQVKEPEEEKKEPEQAKEPEEEKKEPEQVKEPEVEKEPTPEASGSSSNSDGDKPSENGESSESSEQSQSSSEDESSSSSSRGESDVTESD